MDDDYENYYEPTVYDEIVSEAISKIKETIKEDVKLYYDKIKEENEHLKKQNEELRAKECEIKELKLKLEAERQNLNRDFYRRKWSEILKDMVVDGYEIVLEYVVLPKCNKCDDERKITYTSPYGNTTKCSCDCDKSICVYKPSHIKIAQIEIGKDWHQQVWIYPKYFSERNGGDRYIEIKFEEFKETFTEPDNKTHYGYYYISKEECQKHCDFLNAKSKEDEGT